MEIEKIVLTLALFAVAIISIAISTAIINILGLDIMLSCILVVILSFILSILTALAILGMINEKIEKYTN